MTKHQLTFSMLIFAFVFVISIYQLPYYIYKPGTANGLDSIVLVEDGYQSEGEMHLVTVSGSRATLSQYLATKLSKYSEIVPLEDVRPAGMSDEEYMRGQLRLMENSQESSIAVAYEAAGEEVEITYRGVYVVSVIDGMPAKDVLETGDRIIQIDDKIVQKASDLTTYVKEKQAENQVQLKVDRNGQEVIETVKLQEFEDIPGFVGLGIELVTDREVVTQPEVIFSSGEIGGPSAGLMFALEIYDQLTEEDLTKGLHVVGTGTLDYDGHVGRIGGVDKKVVAADKAKGDVFFVPYEAGSPTSNYETAKKTAEEIGTDMVIVPVDTFDEALEYLRNM